MAMSSSGAASRGLALALCALLGACATVDTGVDRIDAAPVLDPAVLQSLPGADFAEGEFRAKNGVRIPYRWLAPANADEDKQYPLVLVLHSSGQIGDDNRGQLNGFARTWAAPELRTRYQAFVLVPQFPTRSAEYDDSAKPQLARGTPALSAALEMVDAFVAGHPVDRRRIYVTGFSMGGSATWLAPLLRPDLFAAAMPISGIAPDRASAPRLTALPIRVLHGDADTENPIDSDRAMVAAIRAAGGENVRLREYAGLEHTVAGDVFLGTWWRDWMFEQRRPKPEE
ncbi:prolyl oligopeptidase family serine peptidase [Luteimonas sp. SX5]|uniref:Prolyl oligopeptidase family serine peptidase n=1 Tax=Luteimonas galliterrae TaxID=2940486 RepID=A0ABT0MLY9_9GAMM|nr:PHB depolymerase family esterase [Luteimonas galliterrae]MCL1635906.1 prolyl oligopeptidase family serine peptidase [Luteimonas galliterrae]